MVGHGTLMAEARLPGRGSERRYRANRTDFAVSIQGAQLRPQSSLLRECNSRVKLHDETTIPSVHVPPTSLHRCILDNLPHALSDVRGIWCGDSKIHDPQVPAEAVFNHPHGDERCKKQQRGKNSRDGQARAGGHADACDDENRCRARVSRYRRR